MPVTAASVPPCPFGQVHIFRLTHYGPDLTDLAHTQLRTGCLLVEQRAKKALQGADVGSLLSTEHLFFLQGSEALGKPLLLYHLRAFVVGHTGVGYATCRKGRLQLSRPLCEVFLRCCRKSTTKAGEV